MKPKSRGELNVIQLRLVSSVVKLGVDLMLPSKITKCSARTALRFEKFQCVFELAHMGEGRRRKTNAYTSVLMHNTSIRT